MLSLRWWVSSYLVLVGFGPSLAQAAPSGGPRLFVSNNLTENNPGGRVLEYDGGTGQFVDLLAGLSTPRGLAYRPGQYLYVASANAHSVFRISLGGPLQVIGFVTPAGGLEFPSGVTFGPDGNLYVASGSATSEVRRYDGATGALIDVFATDPQIVGGPSDLKFGPDGNLYLATVGDGIYRFEGATGAALGQLAPRSATGLIVGFDFGPDGNLYVGDEPGNAIRRFNPTTGSVIDVFVPPGSGGLNGPNGIAFGPDGNLYVAGGFNDAILRYDGQTGDFLDVFASLPLDAPQYLLFIPESSTGVLLILGLAMSGARRPRSSVSRSDFRSHDAPQQLS